MDYGDIIMKEPYNDKQLENIARWIIEASSNPIDEIQDLLYKSMHYETENFISLWSEIVEEND